MSQVSFRDLEIVGLKSQNKNLVDAVLKKEEERKALENKYKELLDKNEKLVKQLSGKLPMQGERHLIWDMIIAEAIKGRPYFNYILEKEMDINGARQSCTAVKETLNKKHVDTTKNAINFLNILLEEDLRTIGIKDRITVITRVRKIVGKHQHIDTVQEKINIMQD